MKTVRPTTRNIRIQAFVTVTDEKGKVLARGKSKPNNLILDNFGSLLAALISTVAMDATKNVTLTDDGGNSRVLVTAAKLPSGSGSYYILYTEFFPVGGQLRVGSGTTPPDRGDDSITTPFTTAPESGYFDAGSGSYAAGTVSISGAITAGGSGTVNEVGLFLFLCFPTGPTQYKFMMFHDLISPGVSFTPGKIITASYSITL